jgi:phenylpropionate dioxygenase-like ring-hydroxylating dioxygenase large terminal subunit
MLTKEDNELLCRVGPGTAMGRLIREYWIPALLSTELPEPNGPPERVRLLGEDLVAFRDTQGRVGILAHSCPHRGASLFFGRNEEDGLRCVYHGWKYDVAGRCVDMPNEPHPIADFELRNAESTPVDSSIRNPHSAIKAVAYPCRERGGVVWTYMGPRAEPPPLPDLEPNMLRDGEYQVGKVLRECNWFQGLEGEIDTSHFGFLHLGAVSPENAIPGSFDYYTVKDKAPLYNTLDTDFGTSYGAYRPADEGTYYWRIAHFLFPVFTMIPPGPLGRQVLVRAWVPLDDEHVMFWTMGARQTRAPAPTEETRTTSAGLQFPGTSTGFNYLPNTSDWLGKWRLVPNRENDYLIDREAQRKMEIYTGVDGVHTQDQMITESMGPIADRTIENLVSSDAMVIRTRLRALNAAKALRDHGTTPPGVDNPEVYRVRSGSVVLPREADWLEATEELRTAFVEHS